MSPITAAGLVLDIGGAFALAMAFMFKQPEDQMAEAASHYDFNPVLAVSLAKQTADAWVGFGLLAAGFLLQLEPSTGWQLDWACYAATLPAAAAVDVCALILLFKFLRPWSVKRAIEHRLRSYRNASRFDLFREALVRYGFAHGRKFHVGELPEQAAEYLLGRRRWERFAAERPLPKGATNPFTENDAYPPP